MARSASVIGTYGKLVVPATGIYWGAEDQSDVGGGSFTGSNGIETLLGGILNSKLTNPARMAIRRQHYSWTGGAAAMPTTFESTNDGLTSPQVIHYVAQRGDGANFPVKFASPHNGQSGWTSGNTNTGTGAGAGHTGLDRITAGEFDASFTSQFNGLKGLSNPVFYAPFFEFNGSHNNYFADAQGVHGTALWSPGSGETAYVNAYQHIRGLADAANATINHGGNVIFLWVMQVPNSAGWFQNYYPGDTYVDMLGVDLYRHTAHVGLNNASGVGTGDDLIYAFAEGTTSGSSAVGRGATAKPIVICESGYESGASYVDASANGGDGNTYSTSGTTESTNVIDQLARDLINHFPDIVAYVHWNGLGNQGNDLVNGGSGGATTHDANKLAAYQRFRGAAAATTYDNTYFGLSYGSGGGGVPKVPVLTSSSLPTNPTTSTSYDIAWTDTDTPDHWRWRITQDSGTPSAWTTTSSQNTGAQTVTAGHTYKVDAQAGNAQNGYSASVSYVWSVNLSSVVATPTITLAPTANSGDPTGMTTAAFMWTETNADSNYSYFCKVNTPSGTGTYPVTGQTEMLFNVPGAPLAAGAYEFFVKAYNGSIFSAEATWQFVIVANSDPGIPSPVSFVTTPPDPDTDTTPTFVWG